MIFNWSKSTSGNVFFRRSYFAWLHSTFLWHHSAVRFSRLTSITELNPFLSLDGDLEVVANEKMCEIPRFSKYTPRHLLKKIHTTYIITRNHCDISSRLHFPPKNPVSTPLASGSGSQVTDKPLQKDPNVSELIEKCLGGSFSVGEPLFRDPGETKTFWMVSWNHNNMEPK